MEWLNESDAQIAKIELLLKGTYAYGDRSELIIKGTIYDLISKKKIFNKKFKGARKNPRVIILLWIVSM